MHGGHETAEVCDVQRADGGVGCIGRQEKEWIRLNEVNSKMRIDYLNYSDQ